MRGAVAYRNGEISWLQAESVKQNPNAQQHWDFLLKPFLFVLVHIARNTWILSNVNKLCITLKSKVDFQS